MKKHTGIVIKKHFQKKRMISVLEKDSGRIDYIPDTENISLGALLEYHVHIRGSVSFMHGSEQVGLPFSLIKDDILFFHHVLEVCECFLPV